MAVNALAFDSLKSAERLAFAMPHGAWTGFVPMCFTAFFLALGGILVGKMFTDDYTSVAALLTPRQVMTIECIGVLTLMNVIYWLTSSALLRVTQARRPLADAAYGMLASGPVIALFCFAVTNDYGAVYLGYVYSDLPLFLLGSFVASFLPWVVGFYITYRQKRPLRFFLLGGISARIFMVVALVILYLFFSGVSLYDPRTTAAIFADLGFETALKGFLTILAGFFLMCCFALVLALFTCSVIGADTFYRSTALPKRTALLPSAATCLVGLVYACRAITRFEPNLTVWLAFGLSTGLALAFLVANMLLRLRDGSELIRTLVVCFELLLLTTLSFAIQYFGPGLDRERNLAFMMTLPGIFLTCAHLVASRVASGVATLRPISLILSATGTSSLTYVVLVENDYASLLPTEVPLRSLFNFILIATVIFFAGFACARLLVATSSGIRLTALRSSGRKVKAA